MLKIPNSITRLAGRAVLSTKTHSPTILFVSGAVGVVATAVLTAKATMQLEEVLADAERNLDVAERVHASGKLSDEDYRRMTIYLRMKTYGNVGKLYGPAALCCVASIASLAGGHVILSRRNLALTAAYSAVSRGFDEYRKRVVAEYGPDKDREFRYGAEYKQVIEETDTGPQERTLTRVNTKTGQSVYSRFFGIGNKEWDPNQEYNIIFLRQRQLMANDMLRAHGFLVLNDVYDLLGLEKSSAGAVVGWLYDGTGDGYVDFGIWEDKDMTRLHNFVTGRDEMILLDFNVDGPIYQKIDKVVGFLED